MTQMRIRVQSANGTPVPRAPVHLEVHTMIPMGVFALPGPNTVIDKETDINGIAVIAEEPSIIEYGRVTATKGLFYGETSFKGQSVAPGMFMHGDITVVMQEQPAVALTDQITTTGNKITTWITGNVTTVILLFLAGIMVIVGLKFLLRNLGIGGKLGTVMGTLKSKVGDLFG